MFDKIIFFVITFGIGILILRYTEPIVRTVGKSSFAERYLGSGGTYNMWKIIAISVMIIGFLYLIGTINLGSWSNLNVDKNFNPPNIENTQ